MLGEKVSLGFVEVKRVYGAVINNEGAARGNLMEHFNLFCILNRSPDLSITTEMFSSSEIRKKTSDNIDDEKITLNVSLNIYKYLPQALAAHMDK